MLLPSLRKDNLFVVEKAERSVQGLGRTQKEDKTLCMTFENYPAQGSRYELIALAAVADGIGGGGSGHIASNMVVEELEMRFKNNRAFDGRSDIDGYFENACGEINHVLLNGRHETQRYCGSTTLVLAVVFRDIVRNQYELLVINAGDSPLYALDTEREEMKALSEMHKDERGAVTLCFGSHNFKIYREWHPCPMNGFIFLCSDGVTGDSAKRWVGDEEIKRCLLETKTTAEAADKLIMLAQQRGSRDDISVVILEIGKPGRTSTAQSFVLRHKMVITVGCILIGGIVAATITIKGIVGWIKEISTPVNNSDTNNVSKSGTTGLTSPSDATEQVKGSPLASTEEGTVPFKNLPESKVEGPNPNEWLFTEGDFEAFALKKLTEMRLKRVKELPLIKDKLTIWDTDTLSALNSLLAKPGFYDDVFRHPQYKGRLESSKEVQRLASETNNYRKNAKDLTKEQQDKIIELNRCTLEVIFPDDIPSKSK